MASANDNFEIRDGLANLFKMRSKDISTAQDGSLQAIRHLAVPYPVDYGIGGCYMLTSKSGTMAAGLSANAPIYAFRWTSSTRTGILRRCRISVWTGATGFAAGVLIFDIWRVTAWSVADTGGVTDTITLDNGDMRTAMPASALTEIRHSSTATLTAGTRVLDNQPMDTLVINAATTANTMMMTRQSLFDKGGPADHPLVFALNEGVVIQATVPATGTWLWAITPEWDEVSPTNY